MEVRPVNALRPVRAARTLMLLLAAALGEGCVTFDDSSLGTAGDGGVAIDRRDGGDGGDGRDGGDGGDGADASDSGDSGLGQLAPEAAPPATAGDGGFVDRAQVDAIADTASTPDAAPVVEVAPPVEVAPIDVLPPPPDATPPPPDVPPPGTPGPVVHWPFNEGRGLTIADATGKGNGAVLRNGAAWGAGVEGTALELDGENDFAEGTPVTVPAIEAPKSITFFYYRPSDMGGGGTPGGSGANVANGQRACVSISAPASRAGIQIGTDRGRPAIWQWGQNQGFAASPRQAPAGWAHLAYTYDGNRHRLYVDGALVDSSVQTPQRGRPTHLLVGAQDIDDLDNDEVCHGRIDEFRVYDRALSEAEVAQLAKR